MEPVLCYGGFYVIPSDPFSVLPLPLLFGGYILSRIYMAFDVLFAVAPLFPPSVSRISTKYHTNYKFYGQVHRQFTSNKVNGGTRKRTSASARASNLELLDILS